MKTKSNMAVSKDTWKLNRFPNDNWPIVLIVTFIIEGGKYKL